MIHRLTALFDRRPATAEDWLARMGRSGVGAREQARFTDWLEADPANLERYEQAKARSVALEPLRGAFQADLAAIRWRRRQPALSRRLVLSGGLVAAAAVAGILMWPMMPTQGRLYESAPGQISDMVLDDGSRVTLDAGSAIRVSMDDKVRRVRLERGAAYFDVAHDDAHPFQVGLMDRNVIVTGTRFVTTLKTDAAEVALLEGRVVISVHDVKTGRALSDGVAMTPGDQAAYHRGAPVVRQAREDLEIATAWRKRRLIFRDAPLSEVIAAASRYSDRPLTLADPRLAAMRVTAVLPLEGEDSLVNRIDALLPVTVEQTVDGRALVRAE
jgi:transmembrane sensor